MVLAQTNKQIEGKKMLYRCNKSINPILPGGGGGEAHCARADLNEL